MDSIIRKVHGHTSERDITDDYNVRKFDRIRSDIEMWLILDLALM